MVVGVLVGILSWILFHLLSMLQCILEYLIVLWNVSGVDCHLGALQRGEGVCPLALIAWEHSRTHGSSLLIYDIVIRMGATVIDCCDYWLDHSRLLPTSRDAMVQV